MARKIIFVILICLVCGLSGTASALSPGIPISNFTSNVTSGNAPCGVQFNDTTANSPVSWNWSFGDGTYSSVRNATHSYTYTGTYTVILNASNEDGSNYSIKNEYITVTSIGGYYLRAWGDDYDGQVSNCPTDFGYTSIVKGRYGFLAMKANGGLKSWGTDDEGQVTNCPTDTGYINISSTWHAFCAVRSNGTLKAWGSNLYNETSNCPIDGGYIDAVGNQLSFLALRSNGTLKAWGDDYDIIVTGCPTDTGYSRVFSSQITFCALRSNGTLTVWGPNTFNEVSGCPTDDGYIDVAAGYDSYCALRSNGTLKAWGRNYAGEVANCPTDGGYVDVAGSGNFQFVALKSDGTLHAWGSDSRRVVSDCPTGSGYVSIAGSEEAFSAGKSDGTVTTWGSDVYGQVTSSPTGTWYFNIVSSPNDNYGTFAALYYPSNPLDSEFVANTTSIYTNEGVAFTDLSNGNATSWYWDFGDGSTSVSKNPVHTYTTAGVYSVNLQASMVDFNNWENKSGYITVTSPPLPESDFTANLTTGISPLSVQFTDLSVNVTKWEWDFGDGVTSAALIGGFESADLTGWNVSGDVYINTIGEGHTGNYYVEFTPLDGVHSNVSKTINLTGVTNVSYWLYRGSDMNPYTFRVYVDNTVVDSLTDSELGIYPSNTWLQKTTDDFSYTGVHTVRFDIVANTVWLGLDDVVFNGYPGLQNPVYTYRFPGLYNVTLNGSVDGWGDSELKVDYINATSPVDFMADVTYGTTPLTVHFTDLTDESYNANDWTWQTGDFVDSEEVILYDEPDPEYTYTEPGCYNVTLTVGYQPPASVMQRAYYDGGTNGAWEDSLTKTYYICAVTPEPPVANFTSNVTDGFPSFGVQFNDTSGNMITSWGEQTSGAQWADRSVFNAVVLPDDSIVLVGGYDGGEGMFTDVWRSVDNGENWAEMTDDTGFIQRGREGAVALPDGSIVVMGGMVYGDPWNDRNDVWRSTDNGGNWTLIKPDNSDGWTARQEFATAVLPDGSIVVMGGLVYLNSEGEQKNDTWLSSDNGATWTEQSSSSGWSAREGQKAVALSDGSIVLVGGRSVHPLDDVWRSTNRGVSWTQVNGSTGWGERLDFNVIVMEDDSIIMMGGSPVEGSPYKEMYKSVDYGATWSQLPYPNWPGRSAFGSVVMQDDSIVVMGGSQYDGVSNDVWRYQVPSWNWSFGDGKNSTEQNPVNIYNAVIGNTVTYYNVSLLATSAMGSDFENKTSYITSYPLNASFGANATSGTFPITVQFTDLTSNGTTTSWNWSFGDGNYSSLQDPVKTYSAAGTYTVVLNASNAYSWDLETKSGYITVSTEVYPPTADFTANVTTGNAPLAVRFSDLSSDDPTTWVWDFGTGLPGDIYTSLQNPGFEDWDSIVWNGTEYRPHFEGNVSGWTTGLSNGTVDQYGQVDSIYITNYTGETMPYSHSGNNFCYFNLQNSGWEADLGEVHSGWIEQDVDLTGVDNISYWLAKDYREDNYNTTLTVDGEVIANGSGEDEWEEYISDPISYTGVHTVRLTFTCIYGESTFFLDDISFNGQNPEFVYTEPGLYTVTANVGNPYGNDIEEKIDYINVTSPFPTIDFSGSPARGDSPLSVQFTDLTGNEPTAWAWTFGDGETSTDQNPSHTYERSGFYDVGLNATNEYGSRDLTKTRYIEVMVPPLVGPDIWWAAFFSALGCLLLLVLYELLRWATTPEGGESRLRKIDP